MYPFVGLMLKPGGRLSAPQLVGVGVKSVEGALIQYPKGAPTVAVAPALPLMSGSSGAARIMIVKTAFDVPPALVVLTGTE